MLSMGRVLLAVVTVSAVLALAGWLLVPDTLIPFTASSAQSNLHEGTPTAPGPESGLVALTAFPTPVGPVELRVDADWARIEQADIPRPADGLPDGAYYVDPDGYEMVGNGIGYRSFLIYETDYLTNGDPILVPVKLFVARMALSEPSAIIDSSFAYGRMTFDGEDGGGVFQTIGGQAGYFDDAINYWGENGTATGPYWGTRNDVVVAINGSFVDTTTWFADRGIVHQGWYTKWHKDYENGSGFAFTMNRVPFIGFCVGHPNGKEYLDLDPGSTSDPAVWINKVNGPQSSPDEVIVYTPQWDNVTHSTASGVEVLVELNRPTLIYPGPADMNRRIRGVVRGIYPGGTNNRIPFDHIVVTATGDPAVNLINGLTLDQEIAIVQEVAHYDPCDVPYSVDWTKTYASVGGSYAFLKNGVIQSFHQTDANIDAPRTAVAISADYVYFIVADGRQPGVSDGMDMSELGQFAKEVLGASWGINQDGGGSSTMVVRDSVVNNPLGNNANVITGLVCVDVTRRIYLPFNTSNYDPALHGPQGPESAPTATPTPLPAEEELPPEYAGQEVEYAPENTFLVCQRPVTNGLQMINVLPRSLSDSFSSALDVQVLRDTALRAGPGTNYRSWETIPAGTEGVIGETLSGVNGVLAKGDYWWRVDFGGSIGWVAQADLALASGLR